MKRTKTTLVTVLVLAALTAGGWWLWQRDGEAENAEATLATATSERRDIEVVAEAAGLVEPVQVVEVKSNASGELLGVYAETGDRVKKGTLLAEIDPRDVQSAVDQAQADDESARVRLTIAEAEQRRSERLLAEGILSEQEVDATKEAAASARATLVRAETALRLAREKRQDVTLRAPTDGTILERNVEPGQIIASATSNVSGGTTLFRMADLSTMQIRAKVDEVDIGTVHPDQPARVTVEAYPNRTFVGRVEKIEPQAVVEQNVTMFPVLVRLDNPEGLLKVGMNAEVTFEVAKRTDVVAVPNSAVVGLKDARTAAAVLGVDASVLQQALAAAQGAGAEQAAGPGGEGPSGGPAAGQPSRERCMELVQTVRSAGGPNGLSEDERATLRQCREAFQAARGGGGGRTGARSAGALSATPRADETRPGVLFVEAADGTIEPRRVVFGLSDWEYTEVAQGLGAGETVVLVSAAQLQRQQQEMADRVRQRFGGPLGTGSSGGSSNNRSSTSAGGRSGGSSSSGGRRP